MKFNHYIWSLYCADEFVQDRIQGIQELTPSLWSERYSNILSEITNESLEDIDDNETPIGSYKYPLYPKSFCISIVEDVANIALSRGPVGGPEAAADLYRGLLDSGIDIRIFDDNSNVTAIEKLLDSNKWLE